VSLVKYELGFYIPDDDILHSHRCENLKSYGLLNASQDVTKVGFVILVAGAFHHHHHHHHPDICFMSNSVHCKNRSLKLSHKCVCLTKWDTCLEGTAALEEYTEPSAVHQEEPYQGVLPSCKDAYEMVVLEAAGIHSELPLVSDSCE
jgi:hypothetical protein